MTKKEAIDILWEDYTKGSEDGVIGDIGESFEFTYGKCTEAQLIEAAEKVLAKRNKPA